MKYFIVTHTVKDGEYEYLQQSALKAKDEEDAIATVSDDLQDWVQDDYREFKIDRAEELSKEEFDIISKYLY